MIFIIAERIGLSQPTASKRLSIHCVAQIAILD